MSPIGLCALVIWRQMASKPPQRFLEWIVRIQNRGPGELIHLSQCRNQHGNYERTQALIDFQRKVKSALDERNEVSFVVDDNLQSELVFEGDPTDNTRKFISQAELRSFGNVVTFRNLSAKNLTVVTQGPKDKLVIENCFFDSLCIISEPDCSFVIKQSWFNKINLPQGRSRIRNFEIYGGGVLNIACPPLDCGNPFSGPVILKDVYLPHRSKPGQIESAQPMRNLRAHLMNLGNVQAASVVHSAELAIEREEESSRANRIFSWLYEVSSDFGASTMRPLALMLAFTVSTFLLALFFDTAVIQLPQDEYQGWQQPLAHDRSPYGDSLRAITLATQPITNPLGIFGSKGLMVASSGLMELWLASQGIVLPVLIAMFIFAPRRRFKMG